jgi:hypothetical protein
VIRQRFNSGRLARIGAWALAAVTAMAAILNSQIAADDEKADVPPDEPTVDRFAAIRAVVPVAPSEGLLVLRFQPAPAPPPPTIIRRVIVEERMAGATGSTAAPTARRAASAPAASAAAPAASPAPPPPAPAGLAALPPLQSSGS